MYTGTHRIVIEKDDGKLEFDSGGYHFASSIRSAATGGGSGGMVRARRLAQEVSSLATSLPLSSSSSVFVRCDKERLDVMKVFTNLCIISIIFDTALIWGESQVSLAEKSRVLDKNSLFHWVCLSGPLEQGFEISQPR